MNLPLEFYTVYSEWGAETATRTREARKCSSASRTCGRQQRIHRSKRCARPCAQSYMYVTLRGRRRSLSANSPPADRSATLERAAPPRRASAEGRYDRRRRGAQHARSSARTM
eukprot:scaffold22832_cov71-Phaeocystis_antarctica.AAC.3